MLIYKSIIGGLYENSVLLLNIKIQGEKMKKSILTKLLLTCLMICVSICALVGCGGGNQEPSSNSKYVITFDANGGYVYSTTMEVEFGKSFNLPTPTRDGYEFDGWKYGNLTLVAGDYMYNEDITLKASWVALYKFDSATGTLNGYESGSSIKQNSILNIPSKIDGVTVKIIGEYAFYQNTFLTEVTIPKGVEVIEESAFDQCVNLNKVTFADGSKIKEIGKQAFWYCEKIVTISFPATVEIINDKAFADCTSLKNVSFAQGSVLKEIGKQAFYRCKPLHILTLPDTLTKIGERAFDACESLRSFTLSANNGVEEIGAKAFKDCKLLETLGYLKNLKKLGAGAFEGCEKLGEFYVGEKVSTIGADVFKNVNSKATIACVAESNKSGWTSGWNSGLEVGYGLTIVKNEKWASQKVAINRQEKIKLDLTGLGISSATIKAVSFNGGMLEVKNSSVKNDELIVGVSGARTGENALNVLFIKSGKAYLVVSDHKILDFKIGNKTELERFQEAVRWSYYEDDIGIYAELTDNVDMEEGSFSVRNYDKEKLPVESVRLKYGTFIGELDGNGYSIKNVINSTNGFFWYLRNVTIKNIGFVNLTSSGDAQKALLYWQNGGNINIENVYIQGEFVGENNTHWAGIVYSAGCSITNMVIDVKFPESQAEKGYAISKRTQLSMGDHVYAISNAKYFTGETDPVIKHWGLYASIDQLKENISSESLASFNSEYWDTSSGAPVWKNA